MSLINSNYTDSERNFNLIDGSTVSVDVPSGWSSICLDDTITYYIECNISLVKDKNSLEAE